MRQHFAQLVLASLLLAGCAHSLPTAALRQANAPTAQGIGCLPGDCPEHPAPAPVCQQRVVQAIGCLPGECPARPTPAPCSR